MSARVLVVDDILLNVKLLSAKLAAEYFEVIPASGGQEALDKIEKEKPDIVLLDVMMPGMDGFEVCRRIRANPFTAHIPVIMVTALSDIADRVKGLEAGADDFLTKPVRDSALFARIRSLVRLKMMMDEWRMRESTSEHFGLAEGGGTYQDDNPREARVMLICDRPVDAGKMQEILQTDQHRVLVYNHTCDAGDSFQYENYDLVICDLAGSGDESLRFCSAVRSDDRTRHTPILLVVNEDETDRITRALEIGINDYLIRPVDRNELLARVRTQVRRRRYQDRLRLNYERSLSLALIDPLTETFNRRYVNVHLPRLMEQAREKQKPLTVMMIDVDHFKKVNDSLGHPVGDRVLQELGRRINSNLRSFDLAARIGGEEFLVVMLDTGLEDATAVAERLRRLVAETPFRIQGAGSEVAVTISIGVTGKEQDDTAESIIKRADDAMYAAKNAGRNRVQVAGP
ncbi:MAG: PleD family two-component system response regulator [Pseudomonadota bacterium]|nr:PleD family two-component system response regulator [Pseudomonadota bacterium]